MISERRYSQAEVGQRTLVPAPQRLPVECWQPIQSSSERAFDFMAKYGVIGGGSAQGGAVEWIWCQPAVHNMGRVRLGKRRAVIGRGVS